MLKKLILSILLLLEVFVSYTQDGKISMKNAGAKSPKFNEEERQEYKNELSHLYKTPKTQKRDSLIFYNYRFLCINLLFTNFPDSLAKYAEQYKKLALENKDIIQVQQALTNLEQSYSHPKYRNPFKLHQTMLEDLALLENPAFNKKKAIKNGFEKRKLSYFVNFYCQRNENQLALKLLEKYKADLHPDDYEELYDFAKNGKRDAKFHLRQMQELLKTDPKNPRFEISDLWMDYNFGAGDYLKLNMPDSAIIYAQKAFDISKQPKGNPFPVDPKVPEESYNQQMARAYFMKKDYEKANVYFENYWKNCNCNKHDLEEYRLAYDVTKALGKSAEALNHYENYIIEKSKNDSLNKLKSVEYLQIGFETEKVKFEEEQKQLLLQKGADSTLNLKQLEILKILNLKNQLERESILKTLSLEQLQATSLKQSLENQKILSKSQVKDGEIKKLKINKLNQQIILQNQTRNGLAIGIGLLGFLGISLFRYNRKLKLKNDDLVTKNEIIKEITHKIQATEITALRAQMNPHFIFNCLNSIQLFTAQNDPDKASEYLTKFSKLIRLVLENSRTEKIALENELETLRLYVEMESMRFRGKISFLMSIADNVDINYIQIPPLLIQPFVENAIWHGLMHKEEGGKVSIEVSQPQENLLHIEISDDGIGREKAIEYKSKSATKNKSFGMKVTAERIELINQLYNTTTNVQILDLKNQNNEAIGTKVIVEIPI